MDPITIIGTAASVVSLAQAAIDLSKALYKFQSTMASASEDVKELADELGLYSQSLTVLSRLLDAGKSWYSDDVYNATADLIKRSTALYAKIDKILAKFGTSGKMRWKIKAKFAYQEGQIKKLMEKLRNLSARLTQSLITLQLDLKLSNIFLSSNITISSKIQRQEEEDLHPETIMNVQEAQKAIFPKYTAHGGDISQRAVGKMERRDDKAEEKLASLSTTASSTAMRPTRRTSMIPELISVQHGIVSNVSQSFMALPTEAQHMPPILKRATPAGTQSFNTGIFKSVESYSTPQLQTALERNIAPDYETRSLRSSHSSDSFKSAVSVQKVVEEIAYHVKAVQSVIHAFVVALETLNTLIEKRVLTKERELSAVVEKLNASLHRGSKEIDQSHQQYCQKHREYYINSFTESHSKRLKQMSSLLMKEVVTVLHMYSAEHECLEVSGFDAMQKRSERCWKGSRNLLDSVALLAQASRHDDVEYSPVNLGHLDSDGIKVERYAGEEHFGFEGVTWGENGTKDYEVESPSEHQDEFVSASDLPPREVPQEIKSSGGKWKGWGVIAAGITGAGIGAAGASSSDNSKSSESKKDDDKKNGSANDHRGVVVEPERPPRRRRPLRSKRERYQSPPSPGPKPASPRSLRVPGAFDDDLDFTATIAAGLQDTGFDPNIVIDDPTFRRRYSPPGSNGSTLYQVPFAETVSDLGAFPPSAVGSVGFGFVLGEVAGTPRDWQNVSPAAEEVDTPTKLSKKEQKKRDKQQRQSRDVPTLEESSSASEVVEEPINDDFVEPKLSKKEQRKRGKEAVRQAAPAEDHTMTSVAEEIIESPESFFEVSKKSKKSKRSSTSPDEVSETSQTVSVPVDAFDDLKNGDDDWTDSKKSKKKKHGSERFDSLVQSPLPPEIVSEVASSKKSKRDSERYESPPRSVPVYSAASDVGSISRSKRDSERYESPPRARDAISDIGRSSSLKDKSKRRSELYERNPKEVSLPPSTPLEASRDGDYEDLKSMKSKSRKSSNKDSGIFSSADRDLSQSVVSADAPRYDDSEPRKSRSRSECTTLTKKDSFLHNSGILGAGVGIAGATAVIAAHPHRQSKTANTNNETAEHIRSMSTERQPMVREEIFNPAITERQIRPSIDPQYGDLLPLPPSDPRSPNVEPVQELPELLESRPHTPDNERASREKGISATQRSLQETPTKSPNHSAVPLVFKMGNRSTPSSPSVARSSPGQSPATPNAESLEFPKTKASRPTLWDKSTEYKPLWLLETAAGRGSTSQLQDSDNSYPELPRSETTSRSSSLLDFEPIENHFFSAKKAKKDNKKQRKSRLTSWEFEDQDVESAAPVPEGPSPDPFFRSFAPKEEGELAENSSSEPDSKTNRPQTIWQQAFFTLGLTDLTVFTSLNDQLKSSLGPHAPTLGLTSEEKLCQTISSYFTHHSNEIDELASDLLETAVLRRNILKIIVAVDQELGLKVGTIGWSCVYTVLNIFDPIFAIPTEEMKASADQIPHIAHFFTQFQDIVAILARYAVMENLYHQTGSGLSLTSEYQTALVDFSMTILRYFDDAFRVARRFGAAMGDGSAGEEGVDGIWKCEAWVREIKTRDKACQGFRIVYSWGGDSDSDSDGEEVEDVSDESPE